MGENHLKTIDEGKKIAVEISEIPEKSNAQSILSLLQKLKIEGVTENMV